MFANCSSSYTTPLHLADHGGQVASVEQRVLGVSHSGRIFEGFLIGEGSPLWADINHAVTWQTNVATVDNKIVHLKKKKQSTLESGARRGRKPTAETHTVELETSCLPLRQKGSSSIWLRFLQVWLHVSTVGSNGERGKTVSTFTYKNKVPG